MLSINIQRPTVGKVVVSIIVTDNEGSGTVIVPPEPDTPDDLYSAPSGGGIYAGAAHP